MLSPNDKIINITLTVGDKTEVVRTVAETKDRALAKELVQWDPFCWNAAFQSEFTSSYRYL